MDVIGFYVPMPIGLAIFTAVICIIYIIISEIAWKKMAHLPEDEEPWDEQEHFIIDFEEEFEQKVANDAKK